MTRALDARRWRWRASALVLLAVASGSCGPAVGRQSVAVSPTPPRAGRFGSLRDFVLIQRPSAAGESERGPTYFFLDRFEVTRGDWATFAEAPEGLAVAAGEAAVAGDPVLPVGRISLVQARAFARWRFARLPRLDEWLVAAVGDGRNRFPWGSKEDPTRANTGELGLGEPTPVGTFESGRRADGWPYDLVGNVSEWTESVPWSWCAEDAGGLVSDAQPLGTSLAWQWRQVLQNPGLAVWQLPAGLLPLAFAVEAGGEDVPREVVGADFLTPMTSLQEQVLAGDRRLRTGVRLCTTPAELLRALLVAPIEPTESDLEQLRRFLARGRHLEVLRGAWRTVGRTVPVAENLTPLGRWLVSQLGGGTGVVEGSR